MGALYEKLIGTASNYLYSYMLIILLVGGGIFFTIRTKGVQVRYLITGTVPVITTHRTTDNAPQNAPRDCLQSRRASKQGKQKSSLTHRRAAAGGESKHYHKSAPAPVKSKPSFPSGWLPRVRGRRPGELWLLSFAGK